jgi:hypothetical protein
MTPRKASSLDTHSIVGLKNLGLLLRPLLIHPQTW